LAADAPVRRRVSPAQAKRAFSLRTTVAVHARDRLAIAVAAVAAVEPGD